MITILFFAQLREQLDCDAIKFELSSPINISALHEQLIEANPHWGEFLGGDKLLFSVNQVLVKSLHLINDGDEVAFFPPVTGG